MSTSRKRYDNLKCQLIIPFTYMVPRAREDDRLADDPPADTALTLASFPVVQGQPTLVVVSSSASPPSTLQGQPPFPPANLVARPLPHGSQAPWDAPRGGSHCPGHLLYTGPSPPPLPFVPHSQPSLLSSSSQSIHAMLMQRFSQGYVLEYERQPPSSSAGPRPTGAVPLPMPTSLPSSTPCSGLHNCFLCQRPVLLAMTTASPIVPALSAMGGVLPMPSFQPAVTMGGALQSLPTALMMAQPDQLVCGGRNFLLWLWIDVCVAGGRDGSGTQPWAACRVTAIITTRANPSRAAIITTTRANPNGAAIITTT